MRDERGRFVKGYASWNKGKKGYMGANKTSFKKGHVPQNHKPVGTITLRTSHKLDEKYYWIKIAEPKTWKMLHVYIWEQANGIAPKGYCVIFKDKNTLNVKLENLMLVKRGSLAVLNNKFPDCHSELKETRVKLIELKQTINQRERSIA
ncbi:HNH endonuclease signature motif containing protein [Campylobacter sp. RM16191]|uniref:HNH endonuclease signature motif containing protein n=1 Tax=Campylobacter sp. RM16191 TaxID=1705728 RepID=UPI001473F46F|nr:HNH endonuclease signature motif containing protein [Campylobacter sp. RM16191]